MQHKHYWWESDLTSCWETCLVSCNFFTVRENIMPLFFPECDFLRIYKKFQLYIIWTNKKQNYIRITNQAVSKWKQVLLMALCSMTRKTPQTKNNQKNHLGSLCKKRARKFSWNVCSSSNLLIWEWKKTLCIGGKAAQVQVTQKKRSSPKPEYVF